VILEAHAQELAASGLTKATIFDNGIYSANGAECSVLLGYRVGPGLVFPYDRAGENHTPTYARVKLDHAGADGKRYRSPKGRGNHIYVAFTSNPWKLCDTKQTLFITEGEKKTLALVQAGFNCIGLSGVWSWRHKPNGRDAPSVPIDDLHILPWTDRRVVIVFDSDAATNDDVQRAEKALALELANRGAHVFIKRLPHAA
jgi:hypothetical protein